MKRGLKKPQLDIKVEEDIQVGKAKTRKRKAEVADSPSANGFEDGKYPQNRPPTGELLTLPELSLLSEGHSRCKNKNEAISEKRAGVRASGRWRSPTVNTRGRSNKRRAIG